jgi:hypothetical protein
VRDLALTILILFSQGCGCSDTGREGHTDAEEDTLHDPLVPDGPCGPCDDSDPCTMDLCDTETLECVFLPLDMDFDGHVPTECDGDDCDDSRPDVYTGAREVCLDGVDQDCDTLVDGPIVMRHDVQVTTTEEPVQAQDLVWTGSRFAIAWSLSLDREMVRVYLSRLDGLGDVVGEETTVSGAVTTPPARLMAISLAWSGDSLATLWEESGDLVFTRMSPTGEIEVPSFVTASGGMPSLVWGGDGYGVISEGPGTSVSFTVLDPDGAVAHGPTELTAEGSSSSEEAIHDVTWTGSTFGATWVGMESPGYYMDVYLGSASTEAVPLGSPVRLTDTGIWSRARLAWTGSEYGIVVSMWGLAVFFLRTAPDGAVTGDTRLTSFSASNDFGDVVWTGSEFGTAWLTGPESADRTIVFTLVDVEGDIRYPAIHVPTRGHGRGHSITWTGSEFGVSWTATPSLDDCLGDPPGPDCTNQVFFNRIGLCD